jgi:hypothetical protein
MFKSKVALSVLAVAAALASPAHAAGPSPDGLNVNVTNTPLPVVGNVNVVNTPLPVSGTIANTTSNPVLIRDVDASAKTHFGQPLQNHVMLTWVAPGNQNTICAPNKEFRRLFPNGTFSNEAFVVPQGQTLVVTDADIGFTAGSGRTFQLGSVVYGMVAADTQKTSSLVPFRSAGTLITNHDSVAVSVSASLGSGALIGAGRQVCARAESLGISGGFVDFEVETATVRGYLISTSQ